MVSTHLDWPKSVPRKATVPTLSHETRGRYTKRSALATPRWSNSEGQLRYSLCFWGTTSGVFILLVYAQTSVMWSICQSLCHGQTSVVAICSIARWSHKNSLLALALWRYQRRSPTIGTAYLGTGVWLMHSLQRMCSHSQDGVFLSSLKILRHGCGTYEVMLWMPGCELTPMRLVADQLLDVYKSPVESSLATNWYMQYSWSDTKYLGSRIISFDWWLRSFFLPRATLRAQENEALIVRF